MLVTTQPIKMLESGTKIVGELMRQTNKPNITFFADPSFKGLAPTFTPF